MNTRGLCWAPVELKRGKEDVRGQLLLEPVPALHHAGYDIWADNWFTGLATIKLVNSYGLEHGGTAKTNRLAGAFLDTAAFFKKIERGSYRAVAATLPDARTLTCVQWLDSKPVTLMTTLPVEETGVAARNTGGLKTKSKYARLFVSCPLLFGCYNSGMGGVDQMDQMVTKYYRNTRYV